MPITFDIPLDPVHREAARLLAGTRDPSLYESQPFYLNLKKESDELAKSVASMGSQLNTPSLGDRVWRRQCEYNIKQAKARLKFIRAVVQAIGTLAAQARGQRNKESNIKAARDHNETVLAALKTVLRRELGQDRYMELLNMALQERERYSNLAP